MLCRWKEIADLRRSGADKLGCMKHNQSLITLALVAGAVVGGGADPRLQPLRSTHRPAGRGVHRGDRVLYDSVLGRPARNIQIVLCRRDEVGGAPPAHSPLAISAGEISHLSR